MFVIAPLIFHTCLAWCHHPQIVKHLKGQLSLNNLMPNFTRGFPLVTTMGIIHCIMGMVHCKFLFKELSELLTIQWSVLCHHVWKYSAHCQIKGKFKELIHLTFSPTKIPEKELEFYSSQKKVASNGFENKMWVATIIRHSLPGKQRKEHTLLIRQTKTHAYSVHTYTHTHFLSKEPKQSIESWIGQPQSDILSWWIGQPQSDILSWWIGQPQSDILSCGLDSLSQTFFPVDRTALVRHSFLVDRTASVRHSFLVDRTTSVRHSFLVDRTASVWHSFLVDQTASVRHSFLVDRTASVKYSFLVDRTASVRHSFLRFRVKSSIDLSKVLYLCCFIKTVDLDLYYQETLWKIKV